MNKKQTQNNYNKKLFILKKTKLIVTKDGWSENIINELLKNGVTRSDIVFYNHQLFSEWKGDLLVTSLKFKMLLKITINKNKETIIRKIIQNDTGRIRDVEIDNNGQIYIIIDDKNSSIFRITKDHL